MLWSVTIFCKLNNLPKGAECHRLKPMMFPALISANLQTPGV
jgi:hypothetical protein